MDSNINEPQMALGEHPSPHIFGHAWDQNGATNPAPQGMYPSGFKRSTQAILSEVPKRFLIKYPSQFYNTNSIEIDFFGRSTNRVRSEVPKAFDAKYQPDSKEPTLDQKWHPFGYHKGTHFGRLFAVVFASIVSGREQKSTPGHKKCKVKCKA